MGDCAEPVYLQIDYSLIQILPFNTSAIELYVLQNNPQILNALIQRLKTYYKDNPDVDPYKIAYGLIPSQAVSCSGVQIALNQRTFLLN